MKKASDEVSLSYANQEGSYDATFKKVKGGYQAIETNYYHVTETPLDASPEYFFPDEGEIINRKAVSKKSKRLLRKR